MAAAMILMQPALVQAEPDPPGVKRVMSLKEMRHRNVVIQEWDLSCGAAALATLLQYQHGLPVTEREIAATMLTGTDRAQVQARMGFSLLDMKRFVDALGLEGTGYGEMTLKDLVELTPAIVPIRRTSTFSHFVIVRGISGDRVILADSAFGNRTLSVRRFMDLWERRVAFVVERTDGQAPPNKLALRSQNYPLPTDGMLRSAIN